MNTIPQDTPQKQCTGPCQRWLPATSEYFHSNGGKYLRPDCKICRNALKQIAREHPEARKHARVKTRAWYATHKEQMSAYNKTYRETHKNQLSVYEKDYYQSHKEQKNGIYRESHKEQRNANQRKYSRTHPIENRLARQRRRIRRKAVPGTLTTKQIQIKLKTQKYACYYCFQKFEKKDEKYIFQLDHTIPISRTEAGPRHDMNYTVLACPFCNNSKKNKLPHEWPKGGRLF